jgi:hypothetical protein
VQSAEARLKDGVSKIVLTPRDVNGKTTDEEHNYMKIRLSFTNIVAALSLLGLVTACQSTSVGPTATSQKEALLVQSGFRTKTVTTAQQQQRVSALPAGKVSTVSYKGNLYYIYPTATRDRILVGNQTQYNAYKQALVAYGQTTSPDFVEETHGQHRILIQEFTGFGPLGE